MSEPRDSWVVDRGSTWLRHDAASRRILLLLRIQPGVRRSEFAGLHGDALKIRIAAPAVDNKANTALVDFLSRALGLPKSAVVVRRGISSRNKSLEIIGGPGSKPGQFNNPWAIALDSHGNLFVADAGNHRVQKFMRRKENTLKGEHQLARE